MGWSPAEGPWLGFLDSSVETAAWRCSTPKHDRPGRGLRLHQSRPSRRRARCVRRGARDADRQVRQMGDRSDQAPRQHQPAAGRRARCWVGCVHRFAGRPAAQEDQGADGARLPQAGDVENRLRILPGQQTGGRPEHVEGATNSDIPDWTHWKRRLLAERDERKIESEKGPARNRPASEARWQWVCRVLGVTGRLVVPSRLRICKCGRIRLLRQFSEPACVQTCGNRGIRWRPAFRAG